MGKAKRKATLALSIVLLWPQLLPAQSTPKKIERHEQSRFNSEQDYAGAPVEGPVELSAAALQTLAGDHVVLRCLKHRERNQDQLPAKWFVASEIHLAGPNEIDFIVLPRLAPSDKPPNEESENACLLGANINPFWVLRETPSGFDLILSKSAHDLVVLNTRSNGHRDIRLYSLTAISVTISDFRFDGDRYRFRRAQSKPIKTFDGQEPEIWKMLSKSDSNLHAGGIYSWSAELSAHDAITFLYRAQGKLVGVVPELRLDYKKGKALVDLRVVEGPAILKHPLSPPYGEPCEDHIMYVHWTSSNDGIPFGLIESGLALASPFTCFSNELAEKGKAYLSNLSFLSPSSAD